MIPKDSYPSEAKILRVVSINVNGLRSSVTKGLLDWLEQSDADVVCIQESRITHEQWTDKFKPEGWHTHLFPAERAGYAGTAIYSRLFSRFEMVWALNWQIHKGVLFVPNLI
jgi:exodeoxyribonuclease-3